jgi:opacity protein-like surface antigen
MLKILITLIACPLFALSQRVDLDLFGGISNYQGDLQPKNFTLQSANPAGGLMFKVGIGSKIYLRTGVTIGSLAANDENNNSRNRPRNLNFKTSLQEFTLGAEYHVFAQDAGKLSPYLCGGAGVYHFNPYTYFDDGSGLKKYFLQPLSTEGQGLPQYPDRKPYKLVQFCLFYGIGVKYQITDNINVGVEFRQTKTNSDYIDDVSKTYVDEDLLRAARGQIAVDLAWRGDEYNGRPYPKAGSIRGSPNQDLYYFVGVTFGLKLFDSNGGSLSLGGLFKGGDGGASKRARNQVSCPKF